MPTAVITGASSGIGKATAYLLASHGFDLVLAARHRPPLEHVVNELDKRYERLRTLIQPTDVGSVEQMRALVDATVEAFGRIDVLINNAGFAPLHPIGENDNGTIERSFAVNAIGPAVAIERAWPVMKRQGSGRIVNVSTLGTDDPFPGFFAYAASKCAVNSFTRSIANEGQDYGIKSFAIAPGAVETRMLRALFDERQIPIEATLSPREVAELIVQCACGDCDDRNGETIFVSREMPASTDEDGESIEPSEPIDSNADESVTP